MDGREQIDFMMQQRNYNEEFKTTEISKTFKITGNAKEKLSSPS